jgi:hypothetical protein
LDDECAKATEMLKCSIKEAPLVAGNMIAAGINDETIV